MRKLLFLNIKRELKILPFVATVTVVLFIGLGIILSGVVNHFANKEENQRFKIALTGDMDNAYIQLGMTVMQTLDDTRFSVEFLEMTETEAEKALSKGDISAYVILPEDFIKKALRGENETIQYVTTPGGSGIVTMFKNEITKLVTEIVVGSQKGTYGLGEAVCDVGLESQESTYIDQMSIKYVELIFNRSELYAVEELGISDGLSMAEYLIFGILTLLFMLTGLPYVMVHTKKEQAFSSVLCARGYSIVKQILCEYISHLLVMSLVMTIVLSVVSLGLEMAVNVFLFVPVILMIAAFNIMIFEMADNTVNGVLLHFFVTICICYVSGCLYPIYTFPQTVQKISVFLPTGMARECLAGGLREEIPILQALGLLLYTVLFLVFTCMIRVRKIKNVRG